MSIKTYKANTNVSINIVLQSKKNLHITFTALSNGSSTFSTGDEEIQKAIERHYNFGKLFRLIGTQSKASKKTAKEVELPASPKEGTGDNDSLIGINEQATEEAGTGLKKVTVSDLAAAKDYLADKFGISRTALRSQKAIIEQATANGIEFDWNEE